MLARSYLRASTDEQDATRARAQVETFAAEHGLTIVGTYVENESGAKLGAARVRFKLFGGAVRLPLLARHRREDRQENRGRPRLPLSGA